MTNSDRYTPGLCLLPLVLPIVLAIGLNFPGQGGFSEVTSLIWFGLVVASDPNGYLVAFTSEA